MRAHGLVPHLMVVLLLLGCTRAPETPTPSTVPTGATGATSPTSGGTTSTPDAIPPTHPTPPPPLPDPPRGFAFSPRSLAAADFTGFFAEAKTAGRLVLWGGPIEQLGDEHAAPTVISTLAHDAGLRVVIQASPFRDTGGGPAMDANLTENMTRFASKNHPEYLALGVEINRYDEKRPGRFEQFVAWYDEAYDAIKAASPATNVFVTFQYEWLEGHRGGLFGGAESTADQWALLARFPKHDLFGFTTYPGLILPEPSAAPSTYYANLSKAGGSFAITEVAHFAETPATGWESSPEEQARFASWFVARMNESRPAFMVWLHLHDQPDAPAPFQHVGLIGAEGATRPAYAAFTGVAPAAT